LMCLRAQQLMGSGLDYELAFPFRARVPSCSRPARSGLEAAERAVRRVPAILVGRYARRLFDQAAGMKECSAGAEPKNGKQGMMRMQVPTGRHRLPRPGPLPARCREYGNGQRENAMYVRFRQLQTCRGTRYGRQWANCGREQPQQILEDKEIGLPFSLSVPSHRRRGYCFRIGKGGMIHSLPGSDQGSIA